MVPHVTTTVSVLALAMVRYLNLSQHYPTDQYPKASSTKLYENDFNGIDTDNAGAGSAAMGVADLLLDHNVSQNYAPWTATDAPHPSLPLYEITEASHESHCSRPQWFHLIIQYRPSFTSPPWGGVTTGACCGNNEIKTRWVHRENISRNSRETFLRNCVATLNDTVWNGYYLIGL